MNVAEFKKQNPQHACLEDDELFYAMESYFLSMAAPDSTIYIDVLDQDGNKIKKISAALDIRKKSSPFDCNWDILAIYSLLKNKEGDAWEPVIVNTVKIKNPLLIRALLRNPGDLLRVDEVAHNEIKYTLTKR